MTKESESTQEAVEIAAEVVETQGQPTPDIVTLSSGVQLRCKAVPLMTLRYAMSQVTKPKPPLKEIPEKGRSEPWEGDPDYQQALQDWNFQLSEVTLNVMLSLGTSLEYVPEDAEGPEDQGWVQMMEAAGVPLKLGGKAARYISWLRFYALSEPEDIGRVSETIARKSGVLENEVVAAIESFRGGEDGGADTSTRTSQRSENGNNLSPPNGRTRARGRRAG